jgi:phosphate/sulfate permease
MKYRDALRYTSHRIFLSLIDRGLWRDLGFALSELARTLSAIAVLAASLVLFPLFALLLAVVVFSDNRRTAGSREHEPQAVKESDPLNQP